MPITYLTLTADDQADILVNTLKAQEQSHFQHAMNVARYSELLTAAIINPSVPKAFEERIAGLLVTETEALAVHESLLAQTTAQVAAMDVAAALARLKVKEDAALGLAKIGG